MVDNEQAIEEAGAQIIWVLEQDRSGQPGTREACDELFDVEGSVVGICVGDSQTEPEPGTFDRSPFSIKRGFDIIVDRRTMRIVWDSSHGTPSGNDNLSGEDVLAAVEAATANSSP